MSLSSLLADWRQNPRIAANIAAWETFAAREADLRPFPDHAPGSMIEALRAQGIDALFSHQSAAWNSVQKGWHPVIVTGTASGKTLCYNLPILERLLQDRDGRALYLFPTKALAHDQLNALRDLIARIGHTDDIPVGAYDGDTPSHVRPQVRSSSRVLITNPDMLHTGILPHHTSWADLLRNLQFVVLDEMHTYRGVFGSHVANVLCRLKRLARFYGSAPQFILTSATIDNPVELAEKLIQEPVTLIDRDGSARGARHFLIYNPPVIDPDLGLRENVLMEAVRLASDLLLHDVQTIVFAPARRAVELVLSYLRQSTENAGQSDQRIRGYRSGYLSKERREIEQGLRDGRVRAAVATTALELGIDIGGMDATLLTGYPGTIAATWQQAGRAGRGTLPALTVLLVTSKPLDQFLAHHPEYFFGRTPERALIDPENLLILLEHLRCAAFELPFSAASGYGDLDESRLDEFLQVLEAQGALRRSGERYYWMSDQYPAAQVSLRSASPRTVTLDVEQEGAHTLIGQIDLESAYWMVHPGAVYLHESRSFLVKELDLERASAQLVPSRLGYYTEPRSETNVSVLAQLGQEQVSGAAKSYGEISVTSQVIGYRKLRWFSQEQLGLESLEMPVTELVTVGYWIAPLDDTVQRLRAQGLWKNDENNYGPNWTVQRDVARDRDAHRCQSCGLPEEGHAHHVHHKQPFRTFDSYRQANQLNNLVTLCPRCHRRVEAAVRMRSGLAGLSYVLRRLAPLFLMCDSRDIGVHSDPRSPLADNKPAVVVYDQIPGGLGFSQRLYDLHGHLVLRASEWVSACPCSDGCPSCVGPAGENGIGGKQETLALIRALLPEPHILVRSP